MYGKFLGIDFRNDDIKVALINRSLREEKLEEYYTITVPSNVSDEDATFKTSLEEHSVTNGDVSTSITTPPISIRVLNFPFTDSKKISQIYRFELENVSTFNPEEKLHSYHLVKRDGFSEALVCMFEKENMQDFLGKLADNNIDPRFVTFSPFAFSAIENKLPDLRPLLLIDISSNEMNFILFDEYGLRRVRSSKNILENFIKGLDLPEKNSFSFKDMEGLKIDENIFNPIITEIVRTTHFFEAELRKNVEEFIITGDVCLIGGIENILSVGLNKPVSKIFIPEFGEKDSPFYAKSFANALYGSGSGQEGLDLRIEEFGFKGKSLEFRKTFLIPLLLFALLLVFTFYRNISDVMASKSTVSSLRTEIQEEVKGLFPNVTVIPDPVSFMENEVAKVQEKLEIIEEVKGSSTPLDVLRDLSITFPLHSGLKVDELRFETGKKVRMWGRCGSYKELATIEQILNDSKRFTDVKRDQVSRSVNNTVKFVVSMTVK